MFIGTQPPPSFDRVTNLPYDRSHGGAIKAVLSIGLDRLCYRFAALRAKLRRSRFCFVWRHRQEVSLS
jgi:hypothetical protein